MKEMIEYDRTKWQPDEKNLLTLSLSIKDAKDQSMKTMICPICKYLIAEVSTDQKRGIIKLKCKKCKGVYPFNLAYYRRQKKEGYRMKFKIPEYRL